MVVEQQVPLVYRHLKRQEKKNRKIVLDIHYTIHVSNCIHVSLFYTGLVQKRGTPRNFRARSPAHP